MADDNSTGGSPSGPANRSNNEVSGLNRLLDERFHKAAHERDEINSWLEGRGVIPIAVVAVALVLVAIYSAFGGHF
jgi:uncharacterized membrane protein YvbJ